MADKKVYEESTLKIRVKLRDNSRKSSDTARLVLVVDDVDQPPAVLTVRKQWVEHTHTFAKVAPLKDSYKLAYRVEHDTESIASADTYTVWPRTARVKLVNSDTASALGNAPFDLVFSSGEVSHFKTNESGICDCKLKYKATFGVADTASLTFVAWSPGKDHGRDREAKVLPLAFWARFVAPARGGTTIVQHVNLVTAKAGNEVGSDKRGPTVAIAAKLIYVSDGKDVTTQPPGVFVYVKATPSDLTKRDANKLAVTGLTDMATARSGVVTGKVSPGPDGVARFTLRLGLGGKEKCKLEIGTNKTCGDAHLDFVNHRKIWVQAIARAGATPSLADATAALDKVAMKLARDPDVAITAGNIPAGALVPATTFGTGAAALVVGNHNCTGLAPLWTKVNDPLSAYAIFCDYQYDAGATPLSVTPSYDLTSANTVAWPGEGAPVPGGQVTPLASLANAKATVLDVNLHDGTAGVTGTWTSQAAGPPHAGQTGPIPADHLNVDWVANRNKVKVRLPDAAKVVVAAGETVTVALKVFYSLGPYAGWAPSNPAGGVVIALRDSGGPRPAANMNRTLAHEIGHLLHQVDATVTAGVGLDRTADHGWQYVARGHSGGHCAFGVTKSVYKGGGNLNVSGIGTPSCVMFGSSASASTGDFCVKCVPFFLGETAMSFT